MSNNNISLNIYELSFLDDSLDFLDIIFQIHNLQIERISIDDLRKKINKKIAELKQNEV